MLSLRFYVLPALWLLAGLHWAFAQNVLPLAQSIQQFRESGGRFETVDFFTRSTGNDPAARAFAPKAQFLSIDPAQLADHQAALSSALTIQLPFHEEILTIDLLETPVHTDDFSVLTSDAGVSETTYQPGRHYRGAVRGDGRSLAAFSFYRGEIMGLLSDGRHGNLVLGRLDLPKNQADYILYADHEVTAKPPFHCETLDPGETRPKQTGDHPEVSGCVRVFFESDYELFVSKGSVQATVDYLAGAFNQLAALYTNEQISVMLSQVFVWVTPDAYSTSSSSSALTQFRSFRKSFNGDLAHLVGIGGNNLGGIAYVDVLCTPSYSYAFSDIGTSYSNVPTYSWTVEVMTHEMGHNLGSPHTQSCTWPGGAIDNCFTTEGGCPPGPAPVNGGTIMSYCHLTNYGINLSNGFGPLPGDKVRLEVGNAACLAGSCTPPGSCKAPAGLSVSNITGSSAVVSWTTVSGASGYNLQWRVVGAASWTPANGVNSPYTVNGLPPTDEIEVRVQSVCSGATSEYSYGVIFMTTSGGGGGGGGGTTCDAPINLSMSGVSSSGGTVNWSAVTGASAYELSYKPVSASTWSTPATTTATTYALSGLSAGTAYNVRVAAVCASGKSTYGTISFNTLSSGGGGGATCNAPANLGASPSSSTSATVTWGSVTGAIHYQLWYKTSSSQYWSSSINVGGTSYTLKNLTANTAYDVRMRTVCASGKSAYVSTTFTTPSGGGGGGGSLCPAPSNIVLHSLASTWAIISWGAASGVTRYDLQIKLTTETSWLMFISIPSTKVQITNMEPGLTYQVRVRSRCADGTTSAFTPILSITTPNNLGDGSKGALPAGDGATIPLPDPVAAGPDGALMVYPNPTSGLVVIDPKFSWTGESAVEVLDPNGRQLLVQRRQPEGDPLEFDLSTYPAGVYFVRWTSSGHAPVLRRVVRE